MSRSTSAYDQWTQFQEFASFMKGVESRRPDRRGQQQLAGQGVQVRRNWKATVTEQIPDRKIAWSTEGAKGTTKGVVTFHPLADDLTQVLLVIEYYPQGLVREDRQHLAGLGPPGAARPQAFPAAS